MTGKTELDVDLTDRSLYARGVPHDLFTRLRDTAAVSWHPPVEIHTGQGEAGFWSVFRHAEIVRVQRDWATFTATDGVEINKASYDHAVAMIDVHGSAAAHPAAPADHGRVHAPDDRTAGGAPRAADPAHPRHGCGAGRVRLRVRHRLPAADARDLRHRRHPRRRSALGVRADRAGPSGLRPDDVIHAGRQPRIAHAELFAYASQLSEEKRAHPADDVWTLISQAEIVDDDGQVTSLAGLELEVFFVVLALAGSETSRNAISQGLIALMEHPDQLALFRGDSGVRRSATEEILRWTSPVLFFGRTATCDVELGGELISAGDRVVVWYPSGNRDERAFATRSASTLSGTRTRT